MENWKRQHLLFGMTECKAIVSMKMKLPSSCLYILPLQCQLLCQFNDSISLQCELVSGSHAPGSLSSLSSGHNCLLCFVVVRSGKHHFFARFCSCQTKGDTLQQYADDSSDLWQTTCCSSPLPWSQRVFACHSNLEASSADQALSYRS